MFVLFIHLMFAHLSHSFAVITCNSVHIFLIQISILSYYFSLNDSPEFPAALWPNSLARVNSQLQHLKLKTPWKVYPQLVP